MQEARNKTKNRSLLFRLGLLSAIITFVMSALAGCGSTRHVQILAINDFHGQVSTGGSVSDRPVGGAPVLAAYIKAAVSGQEDETFIVETGDLVGASPPVSALLQDEPSIMFFNLLANSSCSYDNRLHPKCNMVGTIGNHEFDEGKDEMLRLYSGGNHAKGPFLEDPWRGARFPLVCANVLFTATGLPVLPPYVIKKVQDVPIAFVGAILQDTASIVTASGVAGLTFLGEAEAINDQVKILRDEGVKTIIVLLHQGGSQSPYPGATDPLADDLAGDVLNIVKALNSEVDVVIGGHWHTFTNALVENRHGRPILVTQAWSKGMAYADIDLQISRGTADVVAKSAQIVTTWADAGPGLYPDARVAGLVDQARSATTPLTGRVIAESSADITRTQNSAGESALGDLIADAQRNRMGSDFAFINSGGIRGDLQAGDISWGDLYRAQPFNNYLIKMELTGQQIYQLLNQQYPPYQPFDRILQISGLSYSWDGSRPGNSRIVEVRKDNRPIDPLTSYTVTVNSFLAEGGDNFSVFGKGRVLEVGPIDLDAMIEYVKGLAQPFSRAIVGRINRLD